MLVGTADYANALPGTRCQKAWSFEVRAMVTLCHANPQRVLLLLLHAQPLFLANLTLQLAVLAFQLQLLLKPFAQVLLLEVHWILPNQAHTQT